ncbi:amidohydrolase [Zobellella taiwanensis]|uniref:Amidohydrolase n=1 Tax=Zobellella taiwanensis TaxID=347535 RepID=A0A2P7QWY4_9GAMM|nr:amidohydrolase [Zobellella taiwanensis]PSJ42472.1 amidohydrolase [Zobellella taiwanensis]
MQIHELIKGALARVYDDIDHLYQDLHRHPELPFEEVETSRKLAARLDAIGYEVTTGLGKTGVVGLLQNGEGPCVMLRGDMDALPIREQTGLDYASCRHGGEGPAVMHACGHDLHASCLTGAAAVLHALREHWRGTLMVVHQPAEEVFGGARAMLRDGLYERIARPDVILGQHNMPALAGMVGHIAGRAMAAATTLGVTIHGNGGHGSMPAQAVDPVVIAAHAVVRLQTIVSREVEPSEQVVVTVGKLQAGTQGNIIPHSAELEINVRCFSDALLQQVLDAIRRIIDAECLAGRSPKPAEYRVLSETITLDNDAATVERLRRAHGDYFGEPQLFEMGRLGGSEDFPYFGNAAAGGFEGGDIPYAYWFIGAATAESWAGTRGERVYDRMRQLPMPHSPYYAPDRQPALETGTAALVTGALEFLAAR